MNTCKYGHKNTDLKYVSPNRTFSPSVLFPLSPERGEKDERSRVDDSISPDQKTDPY